MFEFSVPTKVIYGDGFINKVGDITKDYGERIFLVTDAKTMQETGYITKVKKLLEDQSYGVLLFNKIYSSSKNDSNSNIVNRGADQARHAKCDVIVGFGGKTTLNIAKAISFLVSNGGNLEDYFLGRKGNEKKVTYIEIPTAYGFMPGLSNSFYILDKFDSVKKGIETSNNYADVVLVDPKLTTTIPGKLSAYIGIENLSLAIESFISKKNNPFAEALSIKAIELVYNNLAKSLQDPENISFKGLLCTSGILTSLAVANSSPGLCYAISLAMNSVFGVYQGLVSSILLPQVMEFNITSSANKYVYVAKALGKNVLDITVVEAAIKAIEEVRKIISDLRIPTKLSELNIDKEELMQVAKLVRQYEFIQYLPRPVTKDDIYSILVAAY
ncbi:MAG: iron-containing alcohol dehydrogenase [Spirochaetota bacterium]|nr:iron-containing alcohol dehydrogenase [Spirochaetota bacterium]